jgi:hypothetical protein
MSLESDILLICNCVNSNPVRTIGDFQNSTRYCHSFSAGEQVSIAINRQEDAILPSPREGGLNESQVLLFLTFWSCGIRESGDV